MRAILDVPGIEQRDLSSVRVIIAGGEKMPIPFIERIRSTFPSAWFADAYGLTETVSGDTFLDRDSTVTQARQRRPAVPVPRARHLGRATARRCPPASGARSCCAGRRCSRATGATPTRPRTAFAGGWFHTGDIGVRDDDGYLYIVDRLKDMIVSGGENIASSEVERVLYEHDAVVEAAVVGRPDERWGEVPVAFVVRRPTARPSRRDELIEHCRGQLAKFKVPKDVVFIDALPRNPSGKVLKRELRDRLDDLDRRRSAERSGQARWAMKAADQAMRSAGTV